MRTKLKTIAVSILVSAPMLAAPQQETFKDQQVRVVLDGTRVELSDPAGVRVLKGAEGAEWFLNGRRTFLGVQLLSLTPELRAHLGAPSTAGMLVSAVSEDSPASRAGIRVGDVITQIGSKGVENFGDVLAALRGTKDGERAAISVIRNGAPMQLSAQIEERDRKFLALNRMPEGVRIIQADGPEGARGELRTFLSGPEWQERLHKLEDCRDSQQKLRELETRLKELEKRLR